MSEYRTMKFTFPDGEVQEHAVPWPLLRVVKLIQCRDYTLTGDYDFTFGLPPSPITTFRLVEFANNQGERWYEYQVDHVDY